MVYETNTNILSLSEVRRREREEHERIRDEKAKELLMKAISYYDDNYPLSEYNYNWGKPKIEIKIGNETLEKELQFLTEKELHSIYDIFKYFHDERQMPLITDHQLRTRVLNIVKKTVPGGQFLDKLYELYDKQTKINKEIIKLEKQLTEEREKFTERLEKIDKKEINYFICEICGKVCKSAAGLKSHSRLHINEKK